MRLRRSRLVLLMIFQDLVYRLGGEVTHITADHLLLRECLWHHPRPDISALIMAVTKEEGVPQAGKNVVDAIHVQAIHARIDHVLETS